MPFFFGHNVSIPAPTALRLVLAPRFRFLHPSSSLLWPLPPNEGLRTVPPPLHFFFFLVSWREHGATEATDLLVSLLNVATLNLVVSLTLSFHHLSSSSISPPPFLFFLFENMVLSWCVAAHSFSSLSILSFLFVFSPPLSPYHISFSLWESVAIWVCRRPFSLFIGHLVVSSFRAPPPCRPPPQISFSLRHRWCYLGVSPPLSSHRWVFAFLWYDDVIQQYIYVCI